MLEMVHYIITNETALMEQYAEALVESRGAKPLWSQNTSSF